MSRRRRTSPLAGVSRCHPDPSRQGWGGLAQWQVQDFLCWGLIPDVAAVPGRPQCSVTLARCCDRWLSNNARFKCKPKGAFIEFFFFFECNKSVSLAFCNVCPWALQHSVGHLCCKPSFYAEHLAWRWCWKPSARPGCIPEPGDHLS